MNIHVTFFFSTTPTPPYHKEGTQPLQRYVLFLSSARDLEPLTGAALMRGLPFFRREERRFTTFLWRKVPKELLHPTPLHMEGM